MWRRSDSIIVTLALKVLTAAAYRSTSQTVGSVEVRLALRVLARYLGRHKSLLWYWEQATVTPRHPWISCHDPLRSIEIELERLGYKSNAEEPPRSAKGGKRTSTVLNHEGWMTR